MHSILITGSNRGIGLALVKEYLQRGGWHIFATCRSPDDAHELHTLADDHPDAITIVQLDVSEQESIESAFQHVSETSDTLDVLINNAGIYPRVSLNQVDFETMMTTLRVNTAAPLMVTKAARPLLKQSDNARVAMISSGMGALSRAGSSSYAYRTSKVGLNMIARVLASDLQSDDIIVITMNPGWVQTDMGGGGASLQPAESAGGIADVLDNLTRDDSGEFINWDGSRHNW